MDRCRVIRVLYEDQDHGRSSSTSSLPRATGVLAQILHEDGTPTTVTIKAHKGVVVSAGSLHSPGLLQRSGFVNPHIGRHLHLHPGVTVCGRLGQGAEEIRQYYGAPMTVVCETFADGPLRDGYGARIETPSTHPALSGCVMPWIGSGGEFMQFSRILNRAISLACLQRDRGEGRVVSRQRGKGGEADFYPEIHYTLHKDDKESLLRALKGAIKIMVAAGFEEVMTCLDDDPRLGTRPPINDSTSNTTNTISAMDTISYLQGITKRGIPKYTAPVGSAHQMGTCRMGTSPQTSVVDPNGETWECDGLYVMDASIFPTATGANPMVTTMTLSHMLSERLVQRFKKEEEEGDQQKDSGSSSIDRERAIAQSQQKGIIGWIWKKMMVVVERKVVFYILIAVVSFLIRLWFISSKE